MMVPGSGRGFPAMLVLVAGLAAAGCDSRQDEAQNGAGAGQPPVQVEIVTAEGRPFAISTELPGRIEPLRVAEVRARIAGIVLSRNFEEGADVRAGQLLFQIDPAPFKVALSRAEGELAKAEASLFEAASLARRYEPLVKSGAVSPKDFDTAQAALKTAQATRQTARADVDTAKLNLDYATVRAPISGRIGRALVSEGVLVGQNEATALATIQQIDPVYADFRQPAADLVRLRAAWDAGAPGRHERKGAPVTVTIEGSTQARAGTLLFSDITVERSTGQVSLRSQVPNPDGLLLPGMYVRVRVDQGTDPAAILVPQRAVKHGADGKAQILVVGPDDVVEGRTIRTGAMQGGLWHVVEGLAPGERVVVGGAAQPGAKVVVAPSQPAQPR